MSYRYRTHAGRPRSLRSHFEVEVPLQELNPSPEPEHKKASEDASAYLMLEGHWAEPRLPPPPKSPLAPPVDMSLPAQDRLNSPPQQQDHYSQGKVN